MLFAECFAAQSTRLSKGLYKSCLLLKYHLSKVFSKKIVNEPIAPTDSLNESMLSDVFKELRVVPEDRVLPD